MGIYTYSSIEYGHILPLSPSYEKSLLSRYLLFTSLPLPKLHSVFVLYIDHYGQYCYTIFDHSGQLLKGEVINESFFELPEEKQQNILRAAFAEFAERGYERASTNTIIKQAGISKGLLFYYFNNKQELFNTLVVLSVNNCIHRYQKYLDIQNPDYLEWMYATAAEKTRALHEYPEETRFLGHLYLSEDKQYFTKTAKKAFETLLEKSSQALAMPFNLSAFRDDIPQALMQNIIAWTTDGYQKQITTRMKADPASWTDENIQILWDEYYEYLAVMKQLFYKKGDNS